MEKKQKNKKIKHSFASYRAGDRNYCDLNKLAKTLVNWGDNIPSKINDTKAVELALLAEAFIVQEKALQKIKDVFNGKDGAVTLNQGTTKIVLKLDGEQVKKFREGALEVLVHMPEGLAYDLIKLKDAVVIRANLNADNGEFI